MGRNNPRGSDDDARQEERLKLPDELIEYLRDRQRQHRALCPKCGRRPIADELTGWCGDCAAEQVERDRERRRRWWRKHGKDWRRNQKRKEAG